MRKFGAREHIDGDREDNACEDKGEGAPVCGQTHCCPHAKKAATHAASNEEQCDRPLDQTRKGIVAVVRPKLPTESSDEPIALRIGMPLPSMRPGTIRNPPPIPKKPEIAPTTSPTAMRRAAIHGVKRTFGLPTAARGRSIATLTAIMASANRNSNSWPSTNFPRVEPMAAPTMPAKAKVAAQDHLTFPARQWPIRLAKALVATERALVPIATCESRMPTT